MIAISRANQSSSQGSRNTSTSSNSSNHKSNGSNSSGEELKVSKPIVGYMYLFSGALVFTIVSVGGLTRLTESGLSIVEWNVIKGMKPPQSQQEWEEEFEKYKQFPEYKLLNRHITLPEFKFIFYMEWAHRMLGRFIGLSFILPAAYFAYRGYMTRGMRINSLVVALLIGSQGVLGWYMVKSGLSDELMTTPHAHPRVSQYWLAAHLGCAFLIYSIMFITGMGILRGNRVLAKKLVEASNSSLGTFRAASKGLTGVIFVTALSGAFVAGLDAGLIYNEFPFMGTGLVPSDMWALSTKSERNPEPISWIRNLLENPSAVQFNHRILGCTTFTLISALWIYSRRLPLPAVSRIATNALLGVGIIQVTLGITTLLYLVPIPLAAAHQSGSLTLLTVALWLVHTLRVMPK
eukprot:jgi/Hompol1/5468/HPOL_004463-RA